MNNRGVTNKMVLSLAVAVILLALITPAIGIDHPVEPFEKARAMALMEGNVAAARYGSKYILPIEEWGEIVYTTRVALGAARGESILLMKGSPDNYAGVGFGFGFGIPNKYYVSRKVERSEPEITDVDWGIAMEIANKYLQEIETLRGKSK